MINAGKLNKRIELLIPTIIDDGYSTKTTYTETRSVWANVYYVSDIEKYRAGALNIDAQIRFTIRQTAIDHNWRIRFDDKTYSVVGIKPAYKAETFLEVTCGLAAEGV